ncbi:MAG: 50S ribosomal protein L23 [Actinomycetota bacterium]|jgi:large subunit ribosomal protein L23
MKDPHEVILAPVVSEKSYGLIDHGAYTFVVHQDAGKTEIKEAVQKIFGVRVAKVNTLNRKGKTVRSRTGIGRRSSAKRAVVTLVPGDKIEIFETK